MGGRKMIRVGAEVVVKFAAGIISWWGGQYDKAIEFAVRVGTWQTQEQSFVLLPREFPAELSCLSNNEQIKDAKSSLLFPFKESASPQQINEAMKQRTRRTVSWETRYVKNVFIIALPIYETDRWNPRLSLRLIFNRRLLILDKRICSQRHQIFWDS